jgi:hypothetical protein
MFGRNANASTFVSFDWPPCCGSSFENGVDDGFGIRFREVFAVRSLEIHQPLK